MQRSKLRKLYALHLEGKTPKKAIPDMREPHPAVRRQQRSDERRRLRKSLGQS